MKNKHKADISYPQGEIKATCHCGWHLEMKSSSPANVANRFQRKCHEHIGARVKPEVVVCN